MKREFLGDSYDAVKRMWREILAPWAPLFAEPRFFPDEQLRRDFTKLTGIQMLTNNEPKNYSILNDPHTGIKLPTEQNQKMGCAHATIAFIADQLRMEGVRCVITFDQSVHRRHDLRTKEQRNFKMLHLKEKGFPAFYYVSHAPFLFTAPNAESLDRIWNLLVSSGIPDDDDRLQKPY
jgi:hypothetical protein